MAGKKFDEKKLASFLLRIGLAVVFFYAGTSVIVNPADWIGFVPQWLKNIVPAGSFLIMHALADFAIGLWLVCGEKPFYSGLIAGLQILTIIMFNINAMGIIFRDVAILFSSIALMVLHLKDID